MASISFKRFVLIQLSLLLMSYCFSAFGTHISLAPCSDDEHYTIPPSTSPTPNYPPSQPPSYSPSSLPLEPPFPSPENPPITPPVYSPVQAPVSSPMYPPMQPPLFPPEQAPASPPARPPPSPIESRFLAVQGVVYCKSCKYAKVDTLLEATPIAGAIVSLTCNNDPKKEIVQEAKTDKNGYFFLQAPNSVTVYAVNKCRMTLVSSPIANCSEQTDLNGGSKGARLRLEMPFMAKKLPFILLSVGPFAFAPECS